MKILISLVLVFLGAPAIGQTIVIEKTPWGWDVQTDSGVPEMSYADRDTADTYFKTRWPNGLYITYYERYSSSGRFNCHGFAWFMSEIAEGDGKDDPRIITHTNAYKYINDDISYKQVYSKAEADIVWWSTGDHTAITTEDSLMWTSKWTSYGPLVTHSWNDSPFGISNLEYYKRCFHRKTGPLNISEIQSHCKVEFENATIGANVDLRVKYEDWVLISGTFETGAGAKLSIYPD